MTRQLVHLASEASRARVAIDEIRERLDGETLVLLALLEEAAQEYGRAVSVLRRIRLQKTAQAARDLAVEYLRGIK